MMHKGYTCAYAMHVNVKSSIIYLHDDVSVAMVISEQGVLDPKGVRRYVFFIGTGSKAFIIKSAVGSDVFTRYAS